MFGGECVDPVSGKVRVFNDLYRFNCDKEKWTKVLAPKWCVPGPETCLPLHAVLIMQFSFYRLLFPLPEAFLFALS